MISHRVIACASIAIGLAFAASPAIAQTMGEYAGVAAGTGVATSSSGFALQPPSEEQGNSSWSTSSYGPSSGGFGGSAIGQMPDFDSRAGDLTGGDRSDKGRWPGTGFVNRESDSSGDRFSESSDRFPQTRFDDNGIATDFSGRLDEATAGGENQGSRWPGSSFQDHQGLDQNYNPVNPY